MTWMLSGPSGIKIPLKDVDIRTEKDFDYGINVADCGTGDQQVMGQRIKRRMVVTATVDGTEEESEQ